MIRKFYFLFLSLILLSAANNASMAQAIQHPTSPDEIEEAINTPSIKDKDRKGKHDIANYQVNIARGLYERLKVDVDMTRDDEVILVTIPADMLFGPNSTSLLVSSNRNPVLSHFAGFLKDPDLYRMVLVMHHETGSQQYCKTMSDRRLQSVLDWFTMHSSGTKFITAYSMGNSLPILPNNSMQNRRQNRRLEIYLVPGNVMIENAKKGKMK